MIGRVHSFQSLGTVDGPGIRAVVFMQGCPLRCACCHNPDTWDLSQGTEFTIEALMDKIERLRHYFGKNGGVTVSGGEPLLQADFVAELFSACHDRGINTALDTSGCIYNEKVEHLLKLSDLVILDYKYTNSCDYEKYVGMEKEKVDFFLEKLEQMKKDIWIRQVIIPSLNDNDESVLKLFELEKKYSCIKKIELLPFRKLCIEKYSEQGLEFKFKDIPEASGEIIKRLEFLKK